MKKIFLLIAVAFLSIGAAIAEGHMKFLGIEMTGKVEPFAKQIEEKGYKLLGSSNRMTILTGSFAGYHECNIAIMESSTGDIAKVVVMFPMAYSWNQLNEMYSILRNRLTTKYGTPVIDNEKWSRDYMKDSSDELKFFYAKQGSCTFQTAYLTEVGEVDLDLRGNNGNVVVCVSYIDMDTQLKALQKAEDDL